MLIVSILLILLISRIKTDDHIECHDGHGEEGSACVLHYYYYLY